MINCIILKFQILTFVFSWIKWYKANDLYQSLYPIVQRIFIDYIQFYPIIYLPCRINIFIKKFILLLNINFSYNYHSLLIRFYYIHIPTFLPHIKIYIISNNIDNLFYIFNISISKFLLFQDSNCFPNLAIFSNLIHFISIIFELYSSNRPWFWTLFIYLEY